MLRLPAILRRARSRIREAAFWRVQALVVLVTAFHVLLERSSAPTEAGQRLVESLQHVSVGLYIVPVVYAGLAYGIEGGALTALLSAVLASVNVPLFHRDDFAWVTELAFILVVVTVGVAVAVPVERERRQRWRAETAAHRLALLNDIAQMSLGARFSTDIVHAALGRLMDALDIDGASLGLWRPDGSPAALAARARDPATESHLEHLVAAWGKGSSRPTVIGTTAATIESARLRGLLVVTPTGRHRSRLDSDLLSSVGSQVAVAVENSLLRETERELTASYALHLTRAQEVERARLARDLHDGVVQDLTAVSQRLEQMGTTSPGPVGPELADLRRQVLGSIGELRRLGRDLRPSLLDDLGLLPTIEWLVSDFATRTGVDARVEAGEAPRQDPEIESALFRIVQEALRNVERHSGARSVRVGLSATSSVVSVDVEDDGRGFTPPDDMSLVSSGHMGIIGMRERAQLVGGTAWVTSSPGRGTRVEAAIPLAGPAAMTCTARLPPIAPDGDLFDVVSVGASAGSWKASPTR